MKLLINSLSLGLVAAADSTLLETKASLVQAKAFRPFKEKDLAREDEDDESNEEEDAPEVLNAQVDTDLAAGPNDDVLKAQCPKLFRKKKLLDKDAHLCDKDFKSVFLWGKNSAYHSLHKMQTLWKQIIDNDPKAPGNKVVDLKKVKDVTYDTTHRLQMSLLRANSTQPVQDDEEESQDEEADAVDVNTLLESRQQTTPGPQTTAGAKEICEVFEEVLKIQQFKNQVCHETNQRYRHEEVKYDMLTAKLSDEIHRFLNSPKTYGLTTEVR